MPFDGMTNPEGDPTSDWTDEQGHAWFKRKQAEYARINNGGKALDPKPHHDHMIDEWRDLSMSSKEEIARYIAKVYDAKGSQCAFFLEETPCSAAVFPTKSGLRFVDKDPTIPDPVTFDAIHPEIATGFWFGKGTTRRAGYHRRALFLDRYGSLAQEDAQWDKK